MAQMHMNIFTKMDLSNSGEGVGKICPRGRLRHGKRKEVARVRDWLHQSL